MKTHTPEQLSGRDHLLIGRALYVAARALRAHEHPPHSDIDGMNKLLDRYYARDKELYDLQTNLQLALRLGYQPKAGELRKEEIERWIVDHMPDDTAVVDIHGRGEEDRDPGDDH